MHAAEVVEIPGFFSNAIVKRLTFYVEGIAIESNGKSVFIPAESISSFRYGVSWTRGYKFVFGRQYFIELRDFQNKTSKIKLSSIYGIRRNTYYEAWSAIFKQLWDNYFVNMLHYYTDMISLNQPFEIAGINIDAAGISWDKKTFIPWKNIAVSNYRTYFMIYNAADPKQHRSCSFASDWNARILLALLKTTVKKHKTTVKGIS